MAAEMEVSAGNCCYLCNQCASSFASLSDLEVHMKSHVASADRGEEHSPSSSDGSFPMEAAEEDSSEASSPRQTGKAIPCRFCAKIFHSRSLLNIHYTHTHRDKPQYECDDCGQIFSVKRELATHRRIHAGELTHSCAQCGKEFGTRQLLKKHWMWHTGQRSHVCPHCGKAFFQKGHLTQHLMIHAGGRPHVCELCNKTFIFKFDLNRHMKIHAERGYSCAKCGKCFLKQSTLVDHQGKCAGPASPRDSLESTPTTTPSPAVPPTSNSDSQPPFFPPFSPGTPQRFMCLLCMQEFPSQPAYSLHLSYTHFRDGVFSPLADAAAPKPSVIVSTGSSPAAEEKSQESSQPSPSENLDSSNRPEVKTEETEEEVKPPPLDPDCSACQNAQGQLLGALRRLSELEKGIASRDSEIARLREKMKRVGIVAGSLLESCSEFDKLWMLHSKKVYSQIQSVLNSLD